MSAKPLTPEEERVPVRTLERSKIERLIATFREIGSGRAHARVIVGCFAADTLDVAFRLERLLGWYDFHIATLEAERARAERAEAALAAAVKERDAWREADDFDITAPDTAEKSRNEARRLRAEAERRDA